MCPRCGRFAWCAVERRRFSASVILARQLVVPAGSNRSGGGGNKAAETLRCRGSLVGDLASMQAVT